MSKKIVSFVVLLATLLLTLPSQAQILKQRIATSDKKEMRALNKVLKMNSADLAKQKQMVEKIAKEKGITPPTANIGNWDWAANAPKQYVSTNNVLAKAKLQNNFAQQGVRQVQAHLNSRVAKTSAQNPRRASETDVLVTPPAGVETEEYTLSLYGATSMSTISTQNIRYVAFDGNDVYVQGLAYYFEDAYVKGTLNADGQYEFESGQFVGEDEYGVEYIVGCDVDDEGYLIYAPSFVFDFDSTTGVLSLAEGSYYGESAEKDDAYLYDYFASAVYTPGVPETPDLVELPEDATVENWYVTGSSYSGGMPTTAKVAFVDNEVYLSNIFEDCPDPWIKGTKEGNTVTFPTLQYLGYDSYYNIDFYFYAVSLNETAGTYVRLDAITFTYDADAKTLTMDPDQAMVLNAATDRMYYLDYITELTLSADEPVIEPNTVPFTADFTQQADFKKFIVIDNNGDKNTWGWSANNYAYYTYSFSDDADDYLVIPVELEANKNYEVTVSAAAYMAAYPEKFEVKVGKAATAEALNITAIAPTTLNTSNFIDYDGDFTTDDEAGTWYVAIHAISDANMFYLLVKSLSIQLGAEPTAPAAPADFTAVAGEQGALEVNISLTAPATAIDGSTLTGTETVTIYRDDVAVKTFEDVTVNTLLTWQDTDVEDATLYTYYAQAANASGAGSKSEKVSVWVGQDTPTDVENVQVIGMPTANSISLSWDAIVGANGGYVNPATVQYDVTTIEMEEFWGFQFPVEGETIGSVTGETTATVDFAGLDEGEPDIQYFGVKAKIGANESDPTSWIAYVYTGAPYELPIEEGFEGRATHYLWDYNEVTGLYVSTDASDGDGVALALTAVEDGTVMFESFKLDVKATANATLLFDAKKGTSATDKIVVYGLAPDGTKTTLQTVTLTDEYQTFKVVIPAELKNLRWAKIGFNADLEEGTDILLDNIKVIDLYEYDLSIAVNAPASVKAGNTATITATVKNEGENAATGYTVKITAGNEILLDATVNDILQPFTTAEFTAELETTVFNEAAELPIVASVIYTNDLNPDNDTAETLISIKESTAPTVAEVTAEATDGGILVSWVAPVTDAAQAEEVTEDFEEGTGGWTFIDADGDGYNWTYHFNTHEAGTDNTAHSGDGTVSSASYDNDTYQALTPDNWLVSPDAVLDGTFSFWAVGQDADYCKEKFQVYVSTTSSTDVTTFEPVSELFTATGEYQEYTADLSSYAGAAGWVAIRHYNVTDQFLLVVDDITYLAGAGTAEIDHFNIYLDGEVAITAAADAVTATLENVAAGEHTVAVSVVYTNGQESKPVSTSVTVVTDGINSITVLTKAVDVYSLDGTLVRKQTTTTEGLKGAYIVDGKKVILK